ncbi:MAG: bifunctional (p)ppGpp synthetase/guanosine-3',5'-bis(diphosphate) 3'-pyrophosphohydrolase [Bacteroidales bacterium]|nr:bifunctional (p)ppGpp synthetase/guanosine-3',5'-bis(diphosphate) 3'-pyrophosphohydrolase [Bacteroidales bacterium]
MIKEFEIYTEQERERIKYAYKLAEEVLKEKKRENGHPFIEHPVGVAAIVAKEIGLTADCIEAIFLHEALRFHPTLLEELPAGQFPQDIIDIALNLNKIAAIKPKETRLEAENYKRLIVSFSTDPRVVIIKLADRLEVMRNIALLPKDSQERKVAETYLLYIPIAHQLGLYKLKSELEDIFFKYSEPENHRTVTNSLLATERERLAFIDSFIDPLKEKLAAGGISYTLKSRTKTAYSIWKKMQKQGVTFEGVADVFAIRIIIDSPEDRETEHALCWKAYSIVTEAYTPDTKRLRDWLSAPKSNGYESLHTTVKDAKGNVVEVQIRTRRMDDIAENGLAAHWSYKGIKGDGVLTQWLNDVKEAMQSGEKSSYEYVSNIVKDDVFVFTPDGTLRRLKADATVLDFAFDIHTNLGLRCTGAKVDGKIVNIREKLTTGSVVEILSSKNQKPASDWLNYVVTSKARSKIKQKLKEEELKKSKLGRELLERRLKNWKLEITDDMLIPISKHFGHKEVVAFYEAIGEERIDMMDIKEFITSYEERKAEEALAASAAKNYEDGRKKKGGDSDYLIIDGKLGQVGYKMAKCCNPIFGDEVFGFVSIKEGVKIHRISCPNAARLIENYPYRIQKVKWREDSKTSGFQALLKVVIDDASVYANLLGIINGFNISIRSSAMIERDNKSRGEYDVKIQVSVGDNKQLDKIISTFRKTKGVVTVTRN